jgi:phage tail-like protein
MRPPGPKFWLLGDGLPWPTQRSVRLGVSPTGSVSLAETPDGPFGLESADGSVGRLALPNGMAFDKRLILYLADRSALRIRRFEPATQTFEPLAALGGQGSELRQFLSIDAIAIHGNRLYIADAENARVQAFHLQTLALLVEWTARDVKNGWKPKDLVHTGDALYVLDQKDRRVLRAVSWKDELEVLLAGADTAEEWLHLLADRSSFLYVLVKKNGIVSLQVYDVSKPSPPIGTFFEAASVRDRFPVPAILMDAQGRFQMPESLRAACGWKPPDSPAPPETLASAGSGTLHAVRRFQSERGYYELDRELREVRVFTSSNQLRSLFGPRDSDGQPLNATDAKAWDPSDLRAEGECVYILDAANQRVWRHRFGSDFLDPVRDRQPWQSPQFAPTIPSVVNRWFNAQGNPVAAPDFTSISNVRLYSRDGFWLSNPIQSEIHRCQWDRIQLTLAPPPPGAKVEIRTFAQDAVNFSLAEDDPRWDHAFTYVAPLEPVSDEMPKDVEVDFQIKSRPAENLSIQVRMYGDGYETTAIKALRAYYPRDSYLQFLPKVYSSEDEMRRFLEGFLGAFQINGDELDRTIQTIEKFFDPAAVPEGPPMRYLAGWLALNLEATWTAEQNRKFLSEVPKIYPHRGTPEALRDFLRVYLANAAGLPVDAVAGTEFPLVLEGFAERRGMRLNASTGPLWGPEAVRRLQLGEFSQAGDVALISTGDPNLDYFDRYAHRFKVFVPAAWISTTDEENLMRRAIEAEKPAHTAYELVRVENRMRVGVQSTVGFDTIIGGSIEWRLPCADVGSRLNVDTVLGGGAEGITVSAGELILA